MKTQSLFSAGRTHAVNAALLPCLFAFTILPGCSSSDSSPEVAFEKAGILQARGQYEEAIAAYTQAAKVLVDDPDVYFNRGLCYERLELFDKALEDYQRCLKLAPDHVDALNNSGVVLARLGKFKEAAEHFSALLNLAPDNVLALRNRGLCYHDLGMFAEAMADYERALQIAPDDVDTIFQRGNLYLEQKEYDNAIADYSRVLTLSPEHAKAWMNRGVAAYQQGNVEAAMKDLQRAHELDDNIVIPGIDWMQGQTVTEVAAAKPVLPTDHAFDWSACLAFAHQLLTEKGYQDVQIQAEFSEFQSARLTASKDGRQYVIVLALTALPQTDSVVIPAQDLVGTENLTLLVVARRASTKDDADDAAPEFEIVRFEENWDAATASLVPVLSRLKLSEQNP